MRTPTRISAAVVQDYAERKRADLERMAVRVLADQAIERVESSSHEMHSTVAGSMIPDQASRVNVIGPGVRILKPFGQGEELHPLLGEVSPTATDPAYAVAWKALAPVMGTDRWASTVIAAIRRGAQDQRGRTPDYSIRDDAGQSALIIAVEIVARHIRESGEYAVPVRDASALVWAHMAGKARDSQCGPAGDVAGWLLPRERRCGECERCEQADARHMSIWRASSCEAPVPAIDWVTPEKVLYRSLAREVSDSMRREARQGITPTDDHAWLDGVRSRDLAGGDPLENIPPRVAQLVRDIVNACEITGEEPCSRFKPGLSAAASEFLAAAFQRPLTEKGRKSALHDARALMVRERIAWVLTRVASERQVEHDARRGGQTA